MCSYCEKCTIKFPLVSFALSLHNTHTMTSCFRCLTGGRCGGGGGGRGGGFRGGSCCSSLLLLTESWSLVSPRPLTLDKHLSFNVQQQLVPNARYLACWLCRSEFYSLFRFCSAAHDCAKSTKTYHNVIRLRSAPCSPAAARHNQITMVSSETDPPTDFFLLCFIAFMSITNMSFVFIWNINNIIIVRLWQQKLNPDPVTALLQPISCFFFVCFVFFFFF